MQCPSLSLSSRLMHKGIAHCKMSLAVIFIIWFIRCQKSTYASQAARVKKPSRIVVQQIVAHILPTISFNNPFEVQEGRKWNFNDIASSPPPFSSYHTYFTTLKSNAYSPNFLLLKFSCHRTCRVHISFIDLFSRKCGDSLVDDGDCFWMIGGRSVFKSETCVLLKMPTFFWAHAARLDYLKRNLSSSLTTLSWIPTLLLKHNDKFTDSLQLQMLM